MKISVAKCSSNGKDYSLEELKALPDDDVVLSKLVCVNCGCDLTFTHDSAARGAFLKTKNGHSHADDCELFFEREERKTLYLTGQVVDGRLDAKSLKSRLKRMGKILKDPDFDKTADAKPRPKKKSTSETTTGRTERVRTTRVNPTTRRSTAVIDEDSARSMRLDYRLASSVSEKAIGRTIVLGGYLKKVTLSGKNKNQATLIVEYEKKQISVRLRPNIFQYQIGLFGRLEMLSQRLLDDGTSPRIEAVVEVQRGINGDVEAELFDENALYLNEETLGLFVTRN